MPLLLSKKNVKKALILLLRENEETLALLIHRGIGRQLMVLTNQQRVLVVNVPLVGPLQLKEELSVDAIQSLDYFPGTHDIEISITAPDHVIRFSLPVSHSQLPVKEEFRVFINEIWKANPPARPSYLGKNENIIETIKIKQGVYKLTENTLFLFKPSGEKGDTWEIQEKIPFNEIGEFDYYPETPELLYLYIENNRGESRIFKIENNALFLNDHSASGTPDLIIENIYESLSPYRKKPAPTYLYDGEEVITTCRASGSDSGAAARNTILRVTTKRIIELVQEKKGNLVVTTDIEIDQCKGISIAPCSNKEDGYVFVVQVAEDKRYDYLINGKFQYAVDKLFSRFNES